MPSLTELKAAADHTTHVVAVLLEDYGRQLAKGIDTTGTVLSLSAAETEAAQARATYEKARAALPPTDPGSKRAGSSVGAFNASVRVREN